MGGVLVEFRVDIRLHPNDEFREAGTWRPSPDQAAEMEGGRIVTLGYASSVELPLGPYPLGVRITRIH